MLSRDLKASLGVLDPYISPSPSLSLYLPVSQPGLAGGARPLYLPISLYLPLSPHISLYLNQASLGVLDADADEQALFSKVLT